VAEYSPIADPSLVPVTVAAVIGLDVGGGEVSAQRVSQALAGRVLVLVLDTRELVIGATKETNRCARTKRCDNRRPRTVPPNISPSADHFPWDFIGTLRMATGSESPLIARGSPSHVCWASRATNAWFGMTALGHGR